MIPIEECPHKTLAAVKAVLTDIDDTLSLHGRIPAEAYASLEALRSLSRGWIAAPSFLGLAMTMEGVKWRANS
jgi:hypothetical protein